MFMSNIKKAGRLALAFDVLCRAVKAIPENRRTGSLQKALEPEFKTTKKLPVSEFEFDPASHLIIKCPKGMSPGNREVMSGQTVGHFSLEACGNCEPKDRCHSKRQKKNFVVRINLKAITAAKARLEIETNHKENTSMRAGIEGTNSALKRGHGLGKLRVRGKVKCQIVVGYKVIAQNIKRFQCDA